MNEMELFGSSPFDAIKRTDEGGDHWTGRSLMPLMGYERWDSFADAVERAKIACANAGSETASHFRDAPKMVRRPQGGGMRQADYRMTRFGAYLVAMNGDPRKSEVAAAQTYFAVKTREAETAAPVKPMTELEMAERYVIALKRNAVLEPKAEAFDAFMSAEGDYLIGHVAQMLGMGQNTLFARLRAEDVLISGGRRHNTPYQQYLKHFRVASRTYQDGDGNEHATHTTYVKPTGVDWIRKVLKLADQPLV